MGTTNEEFKALLDKHDMTLVEAATISSLSREGIRNYTRTPGTMSYVDMPAHKLKLFQLLLERNSRIT